MPQLLYCKRCQALYVTGDKCSCRKSKYNAKSVTVNGLKFHSQYEANRYSELQLLQRAGKIRNLKRQVPYEIYVEGTYICTYILDHQYIDDETEQVITEDAKGYATDVFKMKKKLVEAIYKVHIIEV